MEYSLVAPKRFVLKLKIHCKKCERKLKRLLQSIQGVHSVEINSNQDIISISGAIAPKTIILMLEKYGRKAELLWEQHKTKDDGGDGNLQITRESKVFDLLNQTEMVEKLVKLSEIMNSMNIEVTQTTIIKSKKIENKDLEVNLPQQGHANRPCVASSSCCGGHGMHSTPFAMHNYYSSWPAPSWPIINPSAPAMPYGYNPPPPLPAPPPGPPPSRPVYSYDGIYSDSNSTFCVIV